VADRITPGAAVYRAYEQFESQLSAAVDQLVATNGFADLLATSATTVMALTRIANDTVDRFVRSTRLAARQDVTGLARQLARTEDKLERLLQVTEELQDRLEAARKEPS
jgi:phage shock protein A